MSYGDNKVQTTSPRDPKLEDMEGTCFAALWPWFWGPVLQNNWTGRAALLIDMGGREQQARGRGGAWGVPSEVGTTAGGGTWSVAVPSSAERGQRL